MSGKVQSMVLINVTMHVMLALGTFFPLLGCLLFSYLCSHRFYFHSQLLDKCKVGKNQQKQHIKTD